MTQLHDTLDERVTRKEKQERSQGDGSEFWQGVGEYEAYTAVVLECIFARLPAPELWRCGGVCRAWRRAADDAALWRRLLLPGATPRTLRALEDTQNIDRHKESEWSWRQEYALEAARWERCGRLQARGPSAAPLQVAALHADGSLLALVDEDAHVTIWQHTGSEAGAEAQWAARWDGVASPEWRGVALAQWAPRAPRLLLAGRLALVERHEMLVVHFDEEWCSRVVCRSASGPGGAGCWVHDDAFLSLRLRLLAPGRACTTLWLNTATQEIYSEFAGVATPLLRIYNEAATHISHILVAEVSDEEISCYETETNNITDEFSSEPSAQYYCALRPQKIVKDKKRRMLIAAGGVAGGARGSAQALLAWPLPALEVPLLWVDDQLAQRVQQQRLRARAPEPAPAAPPPEDAVRALCSAPAAARSLHAQIYGIALHPSGRCVWATTEAGAACVSLPALAPLLRLSRAAAPADLTSHYILPCADDDYFVTPLGAGSGRVCVWTLRGARGGAELRHDAPALAAFLPRRAALAPRRLLVLASDALHIVRSLTGEKTGRARRGSCTPVEVQRCAPCEPAPRPPCRQPAAACPRGLRLACRAPPAGQRPPCRAPPPAGPLTCEHHSNQGKKSMNSVKSFCSVKSQDGCGAQLDRVAKRLAAAERVRRLDYEREVAERVPPPAPVAAPYRLAGELECLRAIDGRDYTVSKPLNDTGNFSSSHASPPCPVQLKPADKCEISRGHHLDPCEHHPRIFLEIDRSSNIRSASSEKLPDDVLPAGNLPPKESSAGRFTKRILESFKRNEDNVCPRQSCSSQSLKQTTMQSGDDKSWCVNLPPPKTVPVSCKDQSLTERLLQRRSGKTVKNCNSQRNLHSKTCNTRTSAEVSSTGTQNNLKQDKVIPTKHETSELKEAGRGRVVTEDQKEKKNKKIGAGGLELKIPPNTDAVRVRVSLDFKAVNVDASGKNSVILDNINSRAMTSYSSPGEADSWLSIKNLQKKFSGYRKNTEVKKHEDYGTCQRSKNIKETNIKKQLGCALRDTNEKTNKKPTCPPTSQKPCSASPCGLQPKQNMSRHITTQHFLTTH